jgi:hypothetical protein
MIAHPKGMVAAALIIGGLTCVAARPDASGRADRQRNATTSARINQDTPSSNRPAAPTGAAPIQTNADTVLVVLGAAPGPNAGPAARSASSAVEQDQPGQTVNYTKDLKPRRRMDRGDSLFSPMGGFRLHMRDDGNLVLSILDDERLPEDTQAVRAHAPETMDLYSAEIWSTETHVPKDGADVGSYCVMQEDGEFVVFDVNGKPCYRTKTGGHPGAFLRLQDDGNVVLYVRDPQLRSLWASNTAARRDQAAGPRGSGRTASDRPNARDPEAPLTKTP